MNIELTERFYKSWAECAFECWEPLSFAELRVGDTFIGFPRPGDNNGHGGLRSGSFLLTKTKDRVYETSNGIPYHQDSKHGSCKDSRGLEMGIPIEMAVIKVIV